MADWHMTSLIWKGRAPAEKDLVKLNEELHELDYDSPKLKKEGLDSVQWRSPLLKLDVFLDFLHMRGFPCSGRQTYIYDDEGWGQHQVENWTDSKSQTHPIFAHLVKEPPSRFDRILED